MPVRVSLENVLEAMELQGDSAESYCNAKTGEIVTITEEEMGAAEDGDDPADHPEWEREMIETARRVAESDDYIQLPTAFDIHEYAIMEEFCLSLDDDELREDLCGVIKGQGAFRRFKDRIRRRGIADGWYRYRDAALRDIAVEWCREHEIEFDE